MSRNTWWHIANLYGFGPPWHFGPCWFCDRGRRRFYAPLENTQNRRNSRANDSDSMASE